jgi:hypothetical protein
VSQQSEDQAHWNRSRCAGPAMTAPAKSEVACAIEADRDDYRTSAASPTANAHRRRSQAHVYGQLASVCQPTAEPVDEGAA